MLRRPPKSEEREAGQALTTNPSQPRVGGARKMSLYAQRRQASASKSKGTVNGTGQVEASTPSGTGDMQQESASFSDDGSSFSGSETEMGDPFLVYASSGANCEDEEDEWPTENNDGVKKRERYFQDMCFFVRDVHPVRFGSRGDILLSEGRGTSTSLHDGSLEYEGGYTLQDIFKLARCFYIEEQVYACRNLSCILNQAKLGSYHRKLTHKVVATLIDGNVLFVARMGLGNPSKAIADAAVELFHSLLVNTQDETALDYSFNWYRGYIEPKMNTSDDEVEHLTFVHALKIDLIEGLYKMRLPTHLLKILNCLRPMSSVTVDNILDILIRFSRHTNHDSDSLLINDLPCLLDFIVAHFLPFGREGSTSSSEVFLNPKAIKLLRVLASSNAAIAKDLHSKYGRNVYQFLCEDVPQSLYHESLRFLIVMLRYGMASDIFKMKVSFMADQLILLSKCSNLTFERDDLVGASLLVGVVEAGMILTAEAESQMIPNKKNISPGADIVELVWQDISTLLSLCITIASNCIREFVQKYCVKRYTVYGLLTSSVNCVASYIETVGDKLHPELTAQVSEFVETELLVCLDSMSFVGAARFFRNNSSLIPGVFEGLGESCSSLRMLESVVVDVSLASSSQEPTCPKNNKLQVTNIPLVSPLSSSTALSGTSAFPCKISWHPAVQPLSTLPFLVAVARAVVAAERKGIGDETLLLQKLIGHPEIQSYLLKFLVVHNSTLARCWFSRHEGHFVYFLVSMAAVLIKNKKCHLDSLFFHKLVAKLIVHLHSGDEDLAANLMASILFNEEFLRNDFCAGSRVGIFHRNFVLDTKRLLPIDFKSDILKNLSEMKSVYVQMLSTASLSKNKSLMTGKCDKMVLCYDWLYKPIQTAYVIRSRSDYSLYKLLDDQIMLVKQSLRAIFLFERMGQDIFCQIPSQLKFTRLVQAVIVAGVDIYVDTEFFYLDQLVDICGASVQKQTPASLTFKPELYNSFLHAYGGCFGGIPTFDAMVLIPPIRFQPASDKKCKSLWHKLWLKNPDIVQHLSVSFEQLPFQVDVSKPIDESNLSLSQHFFRCIQKDSFSHQKTPIPYLIVVQNLNNFIYSNTRQVAWRNEDVKKRNQADIWKKWCIQEIINWQQSNAKRHILLYKCANPISVLGFDLYDAVPPRRLNHLSSMTGIQRDELESCLSLLKDESGKS